MNGNSDLKFMGLLALSIIVVAGIVHYIAGTKVGQAIKEESDD